MLYDKAEAVMALLDDRFPETEVILTRRPRDTGAPEDTPKDYIVGIELTAPLDRETVAFLAELGEGADPAVEFTLNAQGGVGTTVTAVYE